MTLILVTEENDELTNQLVLVSQSQQELPPAQVLVTTEIPGPPGPPGEKGEKGDTGSIGDVTAIEPLHYDSTTNEISIDSSSYTHSFTYSQDSSQSVWTITHNLGKKPSVTVKDSTNEQVFGGDVHYIDNDTLTISFSSPFSGSAYLI